ncbi:DUF5714 domain-containing protein [Miniphocaeibacter massiliensis]|uniref:DUF5714 domain-containing protein n=1 Tax=Miniphocaeibacter massiliensis TaxID=2041841 RepID=UPI000C0711F5|nr:DUF5714 domain-containing protein [Miniphocaeibacter massiliensis]
MSEECLICGKPLEYLNETEEMKCGICGNKFPSTAKCLDGHFVCDSCHNEGAKLIKLVCLELESKNPIEIANNLMSKIFINMHGPEHHVLVGAALLTAYKNAGGDIDLEKSLEEMEKRGRQVPGGTCGFWGACGSAISVGIFVSIITKATPLTNNSWGMSNLATAKVLQRIGEIGGPRCCKRNSFIAIEETLEFIKDNLEVTMDKEKVVCSYSERNNQCIVKRCPYHKINIEKVSTI